MYAEITTALTGVKALSEFLILVAKGKVDSAVMQKAVELNLVIIDLQSTILSVQSHHQDLLQRNKELEEKVVAIENWNTNVEKYGLTEIAPGSFAYAIKPDYAGVEPAHWICANCYQNKQKSILQKGSKIQGGGWVYYCNNCRAQVRSAHRTPTEFAQRSENT